MFSAAVIVLFAVSLAALSASPKGRAIISANRAPAMAPVIEATDKLATAAKESAFAESQKLSEAADRQAALQSSVTTVQRVAPRLPAVTCGAGAIRVESTGSPGNDADYASLQAAFAAINAGTHTGDVNVGVCGDTVETATAILNASGTGAASYTSVHVQPTGARTISGAIVAGSPLIDLNGADFVTIDGLNTGGNSLTISNTTASATASTSTIRLINGAQNNTITNCSVQGSSTASTTTAGGNILISTSTSGANSNNTISGNDVGPAGANLPTKGIMSLGSASPNNNTGNIISNNNVFDFFQGAISTAAGIDLQSNTATTTVSNNRIYQTAPRVFTVSATYSGILMTSSGNANTITGNRVGFANAAGTGVTSISGSTNIFVGINLTSGSTTTATSVQGNTVSGISQSTASTGTGSGAAFRGIYVAAGRYDVGTITGNTVGSLDGSSTITFTESATGALNAIYDFSSSSNPISNNNIGSITINGTGTGTGGFRGIFLNTSSAASATVNNNTISDITDTLVGGYAMYAIQNSLANLSATGNTIRRISGNSNLASTIVTSGMVLTATGVVGPNMISQNVVHSLSNNSGAASNSIYAIYCSFPATTANVVERNFVHSLSITSTATTSQLVGILPVAGQGTYKNNMVSLGVDAAGASITTGYQIYGMFEIAGTNNIYFNSSYVGGTGVSDASTTFAFVSNVTSGARNYIDNIFWNARSNGAGTGKHYAIALSGPGFTSNYNDLYASGTGGFVGSFGGVDRVTLADWQMATGQDANSKSVDPLFVNPNGDAVTVDLHLMAGSPMIGMATPVTGITNDFDNNLRNPCTPDIGADEQASYNGPAVATITIMKTADSASVNYGNQVGFKVKLTNTSASTATGITVTDNLPSVPGVNWAIDPGMTDPGWAVVGTPPNQSLQFSGGTLAGNAMTMAHVISATTSATCGSTLNNTASFSFSNGCPGSTSGMASASIMVTGLGGPSTLLSQNFESGFGAWTVVNNSTGGCGSANVLASWTIRPNPYSVSAVGCGSSATETLNSGSGSQFALANSDAAGSGVVVDTQLISPSFSTSGLTSLTVAFRHYLRWLSATTATVGVSTDGGVTWTTVQTYNTATIGTATAFASANVNLDAFVGQANVMLRFRYQAGWDYYWALDDILVTGMAPTQPCPAPLMADSAASRKTHGPAGDFEVNLPLSGSPAIEPRSGGSTGDYRIVFRFTPGSTITFASASVTSTTPGSGMIAATSGSGTDTIIVDITGVDNGKVPHANPQPQGEVVTVTLMGASNGTNTGNVSVSMAVLVGDVNQSGVVNGTDKILVSSQIGQPVTGSNFLKDVQANGAINGTDKSITASRSGTALPPQ